MYMGLKIMIRNICNELRKNLYIPVYLISSVLVTVVCSLSIGFESSNGIRYSVAEIVLFADKELIISNGELDRYSIWYNGLSGYGTILFPLLIGIGFMYVISAERKNGTNRLMLIRSNSLKYCVSKTVAAVLSSGIILLTGYVLYGIIVYLKFPAPVDFEELYGMGEIQAVLIRLLRTFGYGGYISVIPISVSMFFNDRYILMCLPLIVKYVIDQSALKLLITSTTMSSIVNTFSMERIIMDPEGFSFVNMAFYIGLLVLITIAMKIIVKGRDGYGLD